MFRTLVVLLFLLITVSAFGMDAKKYALFFGRNTKDTTSYVYFTADRVVFGTDPITI